MCELEFKNYNHPWLNSGIVGFYKLCELYKQEGFETKFKNNKLVISGESEDAIYGFLNKMYDILIDKYYTTSSAKQNEKPMGFYYDTEKKKCIHFPKAKPVGTSHVIFNAAPNPIAGREKFKNLSPDVQETINEFLKETGIKSEFGNIYINGRNEYRPRLKPFPKKDDKAGKYTCAICGENIHKKEYPITSSILPMKSGGCITFNSFNSNDGELACWKCNYISKFVPVVALYNTSSHGGNYYTKIFIPHQNDLEELNNLYGGFKQTIDPKNLFFKNHSLKFENSLPDNTKEIIFEHFSPEGTYETILAHLYSYYKMIDNRDNIDNKDANNIETLFGTEDAEIPKFYTYDMKLIGKSYAGNDLYEINNVLYLFRLFKYMESENKDTKKQPVPIDKLLESFTYVTNIKTRAGIPFGSNELENYKNVREKFCYNIINQKSVINLISEYFEMLFRKNNVIYYKNIYNFVDYYENLLNGVEL